MNTNTQTAVDKINPILSKMDLPVNRKDAGRQDTVRWLLTNLRVRNIAHPQYATVFTTLLGIAKEQKLIRAKEIDALEKSHNEHANHSKAHA